MSATSIHLLKAASEILGDDRHLAARLGISEKLLRKFLNDMCELPDALLLRAVDIVLEDPRFAQPGLAPGVAKSATYFSS